MQPAPAPDAGTFRAVRSHGSRAAVRPAHAGTDDVGEGRATKTSPPPGALVALVLSVTAAYLFGWYSSYYGVLPGVFLAADIGLPTLVFMLLRTAGRTLNERVRDPVLAKATGALPKAAGAALVVFVFFLSFTKVPQMAIGLGGGVLVFQFMLSRSRLQRAGHLRMGPGLPLAASGLVGYGVWRLARAVMGAAPGFELLSFAYAFILTLVFLRATARAVTTANGMHRDVNVAATAKQPGGAVTQKVVASLVIGYLVFRIFISTAIPYGPIVEWLLVCLGALFFAIFAADRIGTVPTHQSVPAQDVRTHVQRVTNLPDRRLAETQQHLEHFVNTGLGAAWVHDRLHGLMVAGGVPADVRDDVLAPLVPDPGYPHRHQSVLRSMSRQQRGQIVARALETMRRVRDPTGTLKANRPVRTEGRRSSPSAAVSGTAGGSIGAAPSGTRQVGVTP